MKHCSRCGCEHLRNGRYCHGCHNAYMRNWRKTHPLNEGHKQRSNSRAYANVYKKRGHLVQEPCKVCGDKNSEMHHPHHELPRYVIWLCRRCHLAWHHHWKDFVFDLLEDWLQSYKPEIARADDKKKAA